jgi:hypothetical protein
MAWLDDALTELISARAWGYHADSPTATEPAAFVALALRVHGQSDGAPLDWLTQRQSSEGSLGVSGEQDSPCWPTALAVLAWQKADEHEATSRHSSAVQAAINWLLSISGKALEPRTDLGHDTTLVGWPWVESTHSWVEPTAMAVLALKATSRDLHPRTREAVRMLIDRMFAEGGCNCGNTFVLNQRLVPHVQPSGIALSALVNEDDPTNRIAATIRYLQTELDIETTTSSLSFALLGLGMHDAVPAAAETWLAAAAKRTLASDRSPYKLALLALAAKAHEQPLLPTRHEVAVL